MPEDVLTYLEMALGVAVAVILPPLRAAVASKWKPKAGDIDLGKYGLLLALSLVAGLVVYVGYRLSHPSGEIAFAPAVAAGFGWEALLEKVFTGS